jgi:histone chaperone ASF1
LREVSQAQTNNALITFLKPPISKSLEPPASSRILTPNAAMSIINIRNVEFINNPARFTDPYVFKVTFECIAPLPDDVEWKLIFVSSPVNSDLDQELDDCCIGPVPVGVNAFTFEADPPNPAIIPKDDVLGVAALILTGSYRNQEFVRVGYYQNTEYDDEHLRAEPPSEIAWHRLVRSLTDKPRVTR